MENTKYFWKDFMEGFSKIFLNNYWGILKFRRSNPWRFYLKELEEFLKIWRHFWGPDGNYRSFKKQRKTRWKFGSYTYKDSVNIFRKKMLREFVFDWNFEKILKGIHSTVMKAIYERFSKAFLGEICGIISRGIFKESFREPATPENFLKFGENYEIIYDRNR